MKHDSLKFAKKIVLSDNQYSRLLPTWIQNNGNLETKQKIEIQRTYMGKLGETVFLKFLQENGKIVNSNDMFDIYEGQEHVDKYDFITSAGKTVDIKTGFLENHKRLLVNTEQFDNNPKDFYVGVKINTEEIDHKNKFVVWEKISSATILGYAEYDYMEKNSEICNYGEGPARALFYNKLLGIDKLLNLF